jgi:hypothetical protein
MDFFKAFGGWVFNLVEQVGLTLLVLISTSLSKAILPKMFTLSEVEVRQTCLPAGR